MALTELRIDNFRNLKQQQIQLSPAVNLFFGENGAGKTSILEAVSSLINGKSFLQNQVGKVIHHDKDQFTLFGKWNASGIGIQRNRNGQGVIRYKGENTLVSTLSKIIPLQVIHPGSFSLLEGSASERRKYIDWSVFHVKHEYPLLWKRFRSILSQRNACLKHFKGREELDLWTEQLVDVSSKNG